VTDVVVSLEYYHADASTDSGCHRKTSATAGTLFLIFFTK